jgi:small-conductance mechanosensitive channel
MESLNIIGIDIGQYLTADKLVVLIRLVVLIIIGLPLIYFLSRWLRKYLVKKLTAQQAMIFEKLVFYFGAIIILISILNDFGFKISHLLGAAGILGIAIGFASQTSVSNIISGFFLIAEKPFAVNDIIKIGNTTGVVLSIDTLSVKLRTFNNQFIRIPNETLIKSEIINITKFPIRRVDLNIGVAYKEDIGKVRSVLLDVAHKNPLCLNEPEPVIILSGFGNSSVDIFFGIWASSQDYLQLKNTITEEIKHRFDAEGIEIPFPHLSLYAGSETQPIPVHIVESNRKQH